jgi:hypothetical protein
MKKLIVIIDNIIIGIITILTIPFVVIFESLNRIFQVLADVSQKSSDFSIDIASGIYAIFEDILYNEMEKFEHRRIK